MLITGRPGHCLVRAIDAKAITHREQCSVEAILAILLWSGERHPERGDHIFYGGL